MGNDYEQGTPVERPESRKWHPGIAGRKRYQESREGCGEDSGVERGGVFAGRDECGEHPAHLSRTETMAHAGPPACREHLQGYLAHKKHPHCSPTEEPCRSSLPRGPVVIPGGWVILMSGAPLHPERREGDLVAERGGVFACRDECGEHPAHLLHTGAICLGTYGGPRREGCFL